MKKMLAFAGLFALVFPAVAQKFTFGALTVPNESRLISLVKDDTFTGFTSGYPSPELYYHESGTDVNLYVVSLKDDKSNNGIRAVRIHTAHIAPGNFMAEAVDKGDYMEVNIYTRSKSVMESCTYFDFNLPDVPQYDYALQLNINVLDKTKAKELVDLLNAKQKK